MRNAARTAVAGAMLVLASLWSLPARAQQIEIKPPSTSRVRERAVIPPPNLRETTRPSDVDYYPPGPRVQNDPAFFAPLSRKTGDGRAGMAGWTSPNTPVGSAQTGHRDVTGWFSLGFATEWGGPSARRALP